MHEFIEIEVNEYGLSEEDLYNSNEDLLLSEIS